MTFADRVAEFERFPIEVVRITLDRCANTFGTAPCTATGAKCWYSAATCKDLENYVKTTRILKFQSWDQELLPVAQIRQLLAGTTPVTCKLDPEFRQTLNARYTFEFLEDWGDLEPLPLFDHDKGTGNYRTETGGEFWRRLVKINLNSLQGRKVELLHGFPGDSEADLQLKWTGVISGYNYKNGRFILEATDALAALREVDMPNPIGSDNTTTLEITEDANTIDIDDASQFFLPPKWMFTVRTDGIGNMLVNQIDMETGDENLQATIAYPFSAWSGMTWHPSSGKFWVLESTGTPAEYDLVAIDPDTYDTETIYTFTGAPSAVDLAWDEQGEVLYVCSATRLYTFDIDTGTITDVGAIGASNVVGLAYDHAGRKLYALNDGTSDTLLEVNVSTGVGVTVGTLGLGTITISPGMAHYEIDDFLVVYDQTNKRYVSIDKATGAGTVWIDVADPSSINGIGFADTDIAYVQIVDTHPVSGADQSEYADLIYVDTDNNRLHVRRKGLWRKPVIEHPTLGLRVIQGVIWAVRSTEDDWDDVDGLPAVLCKMRLLHGRLEMGWDDLARAEWIDQWASWHADDLVKYKLFTPIKADLIFRELHEVTGGFTYPREDDQKITFRAFQPPGPNSTAHQLTESGEILEDPIPAIENQLDKQSTRVVVNYKPFDPSKSSLRTEDFQANLVDIDGRLESNKFVNAEKAKTFFARGVYRIREAMSMAITWLRQYGTPPRKFDLNVDIKDHAILTADLCELDTKQAQNADGTNERVIAQVVQRKEIDGEKLALDLQDTGIGDKDYGFFAPDSTPDWTSASAEEKAKYLFFGEPTEYESDGVTPVAAEQSDGEATKLFF